MESTPLYLQNAYVARYASGLAAKYRRTNTVFGVVFAVFGIAGLVASVVTSRGWFAYVAVTLVFGGAAGAGWLTSRKAESKWNADGRLAVAVSEDGIALPRLGTLAWSEVTSIKVYHSLTPGGIAPYSSFFSNLLGTETSMFVDVFVAGTPAVLVRASNPAGVVRAADANNQITGFKGVWGQGMHNPVFQDAVLVLVTAAERQGIPVVFDLTKGTTWYPTASAPANADNHPLAMGGGPRPGRVRGGPRIPAARTSSRTG